MNIVLIVLCQLCLLLAACDQTRDRQYFMKHPKQIQSVLENCQANAFPTAVCQAASQAQNDLIQLSQALKSDPQAFGDKILQLQVKLSEAKQTYSQLQTQLQQQKSPSPALRAQLQQADQELKELISANQKLLTIIRLTESAE